jgi:hypothetical protein
MSTALSWKDMMGKQRANAVASGNAARVAEINAALASNGVVAAPVPAPAVAAPPLVLQNINLSNFKPAQLAYLAAVSASMKPRQPTELELSYNALKKAENAGKKRTRRTRRRKTRRNRRT